MRFVKAAAAICVALGLTVAPSYAQDFPSRPIKIVVPTGPGVSPDIVSRVIGEHLSKALGQPVVVDNRPGASGLIGAEAAAKSPPDGYTLFFGYTAIMAMYPHLHTKSKFQPLEQFQPVTHLLNTIFVVTAANTAPFNTLKELADYAKAKPGEVSYGSAGAASHSRVATELLAARLGDIKMTHVPYPTQPGADLISGRVQLYLDPIVTAAPLIKDKKVKALAITSEKRASQLPDVPALSETFPGFSSYAVIGFYAPKGTPQPIVDRLAAEITKIVRMPEVRQRFIDMGYEVVGSTREEFEKRATEDYQFWGKVISDAKLAVD